MNCPVFEREGSVPTKRSEFTLSDKPSAIAGLRAQCLQSLAQRDAGIGAIEQPPA